MSLGDAAWLPGAAPIELRDASGLCVAAEIADYLVSHDLHTRPGRAIVTVHAPSPLCVPAEMSHFAPERSPDSFTAWTADHDGHTWLHDPVSRTTTRFNFQRARIDVHPSTAARYALVQSSYAAVRAMMTRTVQALGGRIIHASAVAVSGRGLLIVGSKASGKTTLATALLQLGADYLASDRVYLVRGQLVGWPCSYRIAPRALELVIAPQAWPRVRAYSNSLARDAAYSFGGKRRFPPGGLLRVAGFSAAPAASAWATVELVPLGAPALEDAAVSLAPYVVDHAALGGASAGAAEPMPAMPGGAWIARGRADPHALALALIERLRRPAGPTTSE